MTVPYDERAEIILRLAVALVKDNGQCLHEAMKRAVELLDGSHPDVDALMAESEKIDPAALANAPHRPCC